MLFFFLFSFVLLCSSLNAAQTIGDFTLTLSAKAYDQFSGTLFLGVGQTGAGSSALAKAGRNDSSFTAIASDADVQNKAIGGITLFPQGTLSGCDTTQVFAATHLGVFFQFNTTNSLKIAAGDIAGSSFALTDLLRNAASPSRLGRRVSTISSSTACVFARVDSATKTAEGGDGINSAIDTIRVDTAIAGPQLRLIQGSTTTPGVLLDRTSHQARHGKPLRVLEVKDMHWDTELATLFIGMRVVVDPHANNDGFGIVKGTINNNCQLTLSAITTATPRNNTPNTIFAFGAPGGTITGTVSIHRLRTMKTSTGLHYLIINGGVEKNDGTGNKIYALPLGNGKNSSLTGNVVANNFSSCDGCIACNFFDTPLSHSFSLLDSDCSFTVGMSAAPWDAQFTTSDMVVIDDTVYVSVTGKRRDNVNDPGVWASQAQFDASGRIASWTPWERAYPSAGGGENSTTDRTPFFAIDAETGKVWRVDETAKKVTRTTWTTQKFPAGSLADALSRAFKDGIFSVLDLPKGTLGISGTPGATETRDTSIVVFGGCTKVAFALLKKKGPAGIDNSVVAPNNYVDPSSTEVTAPYIHEHFVLTEKTEGLRNAGAILSLGYSHNRVNKQGYFFAGSQNGLYVLVTDKIQGFNGTAGIVTLRESPFNFTIGALPAENPSWIRIIPEILTTNKAVTAMESDGSHLYFVAQDTANQDTITDKLYKMKYEDTATNMKAIKIAESGKGGLPSNTLFNGFTTITNKGASCAGDVFYGILATNDGIYTTTCHLRHLTMNGTEWVQVSQTDNIAFQTLIRASKDPYNARKTWSILQAHSEDTCSDTFQVSRFIQTGNNTGTINAAGTVAPTPSCNECCTTDRRFFLNRLKSIKHVNSSLYFYSDGARRFFTRFHPDEETFNALRTLPYDAASWNMTTPFTDSQLAQIPRIYWITNLTATGQIFAGTDTGAIVLD